ncbi:MAG: hypothetical protein ACFFAB_13545 [Candidatus Heimdallarchaeota archaeon]
MRVYISDIKVIEDKKYGGVTFCITGKLQSGLELKINDLFYDLQRYIGHYVEMLLCVFRNPYAEYKMGMINQPFLREEHYSIELIEELKKEKGLNSKNNREWILLTGEYVDSYNIPKKWIPLIKSKWFISILKEPSAISTNEGIFLLYPFHLRRRFPIENFPKNVSIATGCIDLVAWYPVPQ